MSEISPSLPLLRDLRALLMAAIAFVSVVNPTWALRDGAILAAMVAIAAFLGGWRLQVIDLLAIGIAGLAYASTTWSVAPDLTSLAATNHVGCAGIYLGVRAASQMPRHSLIMMSGFVAGCVWASLELIQAADEIRWVFETDTERLSLDTAAGASQNYLAYAFSVAVALMVLLWARNTKRKSYIALGVLVAAVLWLGIVQTGTRGGLISTVLIGLWFVGWKFALRVSFRLLALGALGLNSMILFGIGDGRLAILAGDTDRDTGTLNGRLEGWALARNVFVDNFWRGTGAGSFPSINPRGSAAHNAFLDLGSGLGLLAVLMFLALLFMLFRPGWQTDRGGLLFLGCALAAVVPALTTGFWIQAPALWAFLAFVSRGWSISGSIATPEPQVTPADTPSA